MEAKDILNLQEAYLEMYSPEQLDEISADTALVASKEAGKRAGILAGLSGGDPKVKEKAVRKREQAERLYTASAKRRLKVKVTPVKITREEYDFILSHLIDEGYTNTFDGARVIASNMSDEWIVSIIDEAEGSYGQTPKARKAMANLAQSRAAKPASQYSKRGEKTKKVGAAEKHLERMTTKPHRGRGHLGPADSEEREHARGMGEVGSGRSYSASGGSVTKNPKKLRKQKAMGEID